ncbi:MAG TPA: hypothetical protein VGQ38_14645 [Gaiellaceae bacterium]|nr:hypothetical protein [Gaiellaceae bacterium]
MTQLENSLLMSLAAVPVYLLARRRSLSTRYALACAIFAVGLPDLAYASYTLADPVADPFALTAVAAGLAAIDKPSRTRQLLFLGFAFLATFARVQYVVLPAAYAVAALAVDRRAAFRTQRLPFCCSHCRSSPWEWQALRACSATTRTSSTCTSAARCFTGPSPISS